MKAALLIVLLAVPALPAADGALPGFLPRETKVVMGVRVRNLVESSLAANFAGDARTMGGDFLKMAAAIGFDPFHDVDELLVASLGSGPKASTLAVLRGRFNLDRLGAGAERYHGVPILKEGPNPTGVLAFLDASTALAGELPMVRAAIDRRGSGAGLNPALAARVAALRGRYDIWGTGSSPEGFGVSAAQAQGLESVDRFQFGILLAHGLEFTGELHARLSKDVEKLAASLQLVESMMKMQPASGQAGKFELHMEAGTLKLAFAIPEAELKKAVETQRAALQAARATSAGPTITAEPQPAPKANPSGETMVVTLPGRR